MCALSPSATVTLLLASTDLLAVPSVHTTDKVVAPPEPFLTRRPKYSITQCPAKGCPEAGLTSARGVSVTVECVIEPPESPMGPMATDRGLAAVTAALLSAFRPTKPEILIVSSAANEVELRDTVPPTVMFSNAVNVPLVKDTSPLTTVFSSAVNVVDERLIVSNAANVVAPNSVVSNALSVEEPSSTDEIVTSTSAPSCLKYTISLI